MNVQAQQQYPSLERTPITLTSAYLLPTTAAVAAAASTSAAQGSGMPQSFRPLVTPVSSTTNINQKNILGPPQQSHLLPQSNQQSQASITSLDDLNDLIRIFKKRQLNYLLLLDCFRKRKDFEQHYKEQLGNFASCRTQEKARLTEELALIRRFTGMRVTDSKQKMLITRFCMRACEMHEESAMKQRNLQVFDSVKERQIQTFNEMVHKHLQAESIDLELILLLLAGRFARNFFDELERVRLAALQDPNLMLALMESVEEEEEIYVNNFLAYEQPLCEVVYPTYPTCLLGTKHTDSPVRTRKTPSQQQQFISFSDRLEQQRRLFHFYAKQFFKLYDVLALDKQFMREEVAQMRVGREDRSYNELQNKNTTILMSLKLYISMSESKHAKSANMQRHVKKPSALSSEAAQSQQSHLNHMQKLLTIDFFVSSSSPVASAATAAAAAPPGNQIVLPSNLTLDKIAGKSSQKIIVAEMQRNLNMTALPPSRVSINVIPTDSNEEDENEQGDSLPFNILNQHVKQQIHSEGIVKPSRSKHALESFLSVSPLSRPPIIQAIQSQQQQQQQQQQSHHVNQTPFVQKTPIPIQMRNATPYLLADIEKVVKQNPRSYNNSCNNNLLNQNQNEEERAGRVRCSTRQHQYSRIDETIDPLEDLHITFPIKHILNKSPYNRQLEKTSAVNNNNNDDQRMQNSSKQASNGHANVIGQINNCDKSTISVTSMLRFMKETEKERQAIAVAATGPRTTRRQHYSQPPSKQNNSAVIPEIPPAGLVIIIPNPSSILPSNFVYCNQSQSVRNQTQQAQGSINFIPQNVFSRKSPKHPFLHSNNNQNNSNNPHPQISPDAFLVAKPIEKSFESFACRPPTGSLHAGGARINPHQSGGGNAPISSQPSVTHLHGKKQTSTSVHLKNHNELVSIPENKLSNFQIQRSDSSLAAIDAPKLSLNLRSHSKNSGSSQTQQQQSQSFQNSNNINNNSNNSNNNVCNTSSSSNNNNNNNINNSLNFNSNSLHNPYLFSEQSLWSVDCGGSPISSGNTKTTTGENSSGSKYFHNDPRGHQILQKREDTTEETSSNNQFIQQLQITQFPLSYSVKQKKEKKSKFTMMSPLIGYHEKQLRMRKIKAMQLPAISSNIINHSTDSNINVSSNTVQLSTQNNNQLHRLQLQQHLNASLDNL